MPTRITSEHRRGASALARLAITRRTWLAGWAAGAAGLVVSPISSLAQGASQASARPWGVQLYTVRELIARNPAATLRALKAIGFTELEIIQPTLATVAPLAESLGFTIVSAHLDGPTASGEGLPAFLDQARRYGVRYVVIAWLPPERRPTDRAGYERLGGEFNRVGEVVSRAGLQLCYHNHAFEFGQAPDGARWLDVLMAATDPSLVRLELDTFWVSVTGANPVDLIERYAGRIELMHLKDRNPAAPLTVREDRVARDAFVEVGSGAIDFPAVLAAARKARVAHYFVEQDHTPGDPLDSLTASYAYLAGLDRAPGRDAG
jgi:sugar phosphate isomerase/epimerase